MTVAAAEPLLRAVGLAKHWDPSSGLSRLWLDLVPGEVVVIRGRSGSGKSTLLALLAGWCDPDEGTIERIGGWAGCWREWRSTSVVPQVLGLANELSVAENLEHVLRLGGASLSDARRSSNATIDALDLTELSRRLPREISLGQQQRVAVGRATIIQPRLLLADEPTSHQDRYHASTIVEALRTAAATGSSVLITSHDPSVAAAADRVVSLDD